MALGVNLIEIDVAAVQVNEFVVDVGDIDVAAAAAVA